MTKKSRRRCLFVTVKLTCSEILVYVGIARRGGWTLGQQMVGIYEMQYHSPSVGPAKQVLHRGSVVGLAGDQIAGGYCHQGSLAMLRDAFCGARWKEH